MKPLPQLRASAYLIPRLPQALSTGQAKQSVASTDLSTASLKVPTGQFIGVSAPLVPYAQKDPEGHSISMPPAGQYFPAVHFVVGVSVTAFGQVKPA